MTQDVGSEGAQSLKAYAQLVGRYPGWRILWVGEILSSLGNWFGFVATLLVVERLAAGRGILLSVVLLMRFLPSFFLFPIAGVFADRYNRVNILIWSCVVAAAAGAALPIIQRAEDLWLLYVLLFIEFSAAAFYDPARRALTPSLVPRDLLHLATTVDSFAWSLTGALGASLGGLAASKLSMNACFFLDAFTYLVAAACNYRLKALVSEDQTKAGGLQGGKHASSIENESRDAETGELKPLLRTKSGPLSKSGLSSGAERDLKLQPRELDSQHSVSDSKPFISDGLSSRQSIDGIDLPDEESAALLGDGQAAVVLGSTKLGEGSLEVAGPSGKSEGCLTLVSWGLKEEVTSLHDGWLYVTASANLDVLALALLKASGSLIWGASDVLLVRFSELKEMQNLGDAAFTLGLFYASVGFACLFGPIIFNIFTPPRPPNLLLSSIFCYFWLMAGYFGMVFASNGYLMSLSIMVKSFGSSVLWVYSTLLLQLRVPDALLGRMMALEMAFFTVAESISGLAAGVALDDLGLTTRNVALAMTVVAAVLCCIWLPYACRKLALAKARTLESAQL